MTSDIYSLAKVLGARTLADNPLINNPVGRNYLIHRERAQEANDLLKSTQTPLGALSSGIALYMQRKREDQAFDELKKQNEADIEDKRVKKEALIASLPEQDRASATLLDYDNLSKIVIDRLKGQSPEEAADLEYRKLQNQKLKKELSSPNSNNPGKAPSGYRYTETGDLERIPGGPADKPLSAEATKTLSLADGGLSLIERIRPYSEKYNDDDFNKLAAKTALPNFMQSNDAQDFQSARIDLEDTIGRMRSGGAINRDEEARFRKLIPKFGDSSATRAKKLAQIQTGFQDIKSNLQPRNSVAGNANNDPLGIR